MYIRAVVNKFNGVYAQVVADDHNGWDDDDILADGEAFIRSEYEETASTCSKPAGKCSVSARSSWSTMAVRVRKSRCPSLLLPPLPHVAGPTVVAAAAGPAVVVAAAATDPDVVVAASSRRQNSPLNVFFVFIILIKSSCDKKPPFLV